MPIKAKELEPKLSNHMLDVINNTHGEDVGVEYDDIERYKYRIMQMLTSNTDLINALHNHELQGHKGDDYRFVNIFNFLKIPNTQSTVKNFVCFEVQDVEQPRYTEGLMTKYIVFRTVSHEDDVQTDYGIARQDLLALIIKNEFDWSQVFGMHIEKIQDYGKITENGYYYREFIYETTSTNNLVNKARSVHKIKTNQQAGGF